MGAFLGISLWVALATVVPGLITIAVVFCAFAINEPRLLAPEQAGISVPSDWIMAGIAVTIMILTQAIGILLEDILVRLRLYTRRGKRIVVHGTDGNDGESIIDPYEEYERLYITLAQLTEHEDSQGHLKRCVAQFFLTNNTLVSFTSGLIVALVLAIRSSTNADYLFLYAAGLAVCLIISYRVAVVRFGVMAKSLWATEMVRQLKASDGAG